MISLRMFNVFIVIYEGTTMFMKKESVCLSLQVPMFLETPISQKIYLFRSV